MFPSYIYKYIYSVLPADMRKGGCKLYKRCTGIENRRDTGSGGRISRYGGEKVWVWRIYCPDPRTANCRGYAGWCDCF